MNIMNLLSRFASIPRNVRSVEIGTTVITVETVSSRSAIDKGLSGRKSLQAFPPHGMLFLFNHDAKFKFWMRGMKFSLDFLWINSEKKIVDITPDAPPLADGAEAFFYSPSVLARYVLEVPAGFCAREGIHIGDTVKFVP